MSTPIYPDPTLLPFSSRKLVRARVIAAYTRAAGYPGVVVFTCGNAAQALRNVGLNVIEVSPHGPLRPGKWFQPAEIHSIWPHLFDATSGHLPVPLMLDVARGFRNSLGALRKPKYTVPTGSGETILCLRWAYPDIQFVPCYGFSPATQWNAEAPLNTLVQGTVCDGFSELPTGA